MSNRPSRRHWRQRAFPVTVKPTNSGQLVPPFGAVGSGNCIYGKQPGAVIGDARRGKSVARSRPRQPSVRASRSSLLDAAGAAVFGLNDFERQNVGGIFQPN